MAGVSLAITVSPVTQCARLGETHLYDAAHKSVNGALSYMAAGEPTVVQRVAAFIADAAVTQQIHIC
jgi:hypothetical protein